MRRAALASLALHVGLIGGGWLLLNLPNATDEMAAESLSVDILSVDNFVAIAASETVTEATQTLISAGGEAAAASSVAEPVVPPTLETIAPVPRETVRETMERVETATAPLEPVRASPPDAIEASTAQVLAVRSVPQPLAEAIAAAPIDAEAPVAEAAASVETPVAPEPSATAALQPVAEGTLEAPMPRPRAERPRPPEPPAPRRTEPARPATAPPARTASQAAQAGGGGRDSADAAARAAAGGQGARDAGGSAATSRYPGLVQARVTRAARYPSDARGQSAEARVSFTVAASGSVSRLAIARSSGNPAIDRAALAAVERAAPFPPIPADAGRSSWSFTVPLLFRR